MCGKDLNDEPHTHEEVAADPRWAALDELRGAALQALAQASIADMSA